MNPSDAMSGNERLMTALDSLRGQLETCLQLSMEEVVALLNGERELAEIAVAFLVDRDEILLGSDDEHRIFFRPVLIERVFAIVNRTGTTTSAEIIKSLNLPNGVTWEMIGWLEREGRVSTKPRKGQLEISVA